MSKSVEQKSLKLKNVELEMIRDSVIFLASSGFHFHVSMIFTFHFATNDSIFV